jgi:hypothetical protein
MTTQLIEDHFFGQGMTKSYYVGIGVTGGENCEKSARTRRD